MNDEWLVYLQDISKSGKNKGIAKTRRGKMTIDNILESVCEAMDMSAATLGMVKGNEYSFTHIFDPSNSGMKKGRVLPLSITFAKQVVNRESHFYIEDARKDPVFQSHLELAKWKFVSYAGVPLFSEKGGIKGILSVLSPEPRRLSASELSLIGLIGEWLNGMLSKTEPEQKSEVISSDQLNSLLRIAKISISPLKLEEIETRALEELLEVSHAKYGAILSIDENRKSFVTRRVVGASRTFLSEEDELQIVKQALVQRKPVIIYDIFSNPSTNKALRAHAGQWGYASMACIPLMQHGQKVVDILSLYFQLPKNFNENFINFLTVAAGYLSSAISTFALLRKSKIEQQLIALVNEITNALTSSLNFNEIFLTLVNGLEEIVSFDHANITLLDNKKSELSLFALISSRATKLKQGYKFTREKEPLIWSTIMERNISSVSDLTHVPTEFNKILIQEGMKSSVAVPLLYKGDRLGIFLLASSKLSNFSLREVKILEQIAFPIASAIKNASLYIESYQQREKLNRINRELQMLDQIKRDLTDMIIHDLRNPLSGIIGYLSLIIQYTKLDDQQAEFIDLIKFNSEAMLNMVNTLLDITKLEVGQMTLDRQHVLITELIHAAFSQTHGTALPKNVSLRSKVEESGLQVYADSQLVVRILVNLVSNAIKFVPEGGNVMIEAMSKPGNDTETAIFKIIDDGEGIPEEYQEKIFEKFEQVNIRKRGDRVSTGLGLTFCKLAVEAHGGSIRVDSKLGRGSVFIFEIPSKPQKICNQ